MENEIKKNGVVFTPDNLADFIASGIVNNIKVPVTEKLKIIEPSVGDGKLLKALLNCLIKKGYNDLYVKAFDINNEFVIQCKHLLEENFPLVESSIECADFIEFATNNDSEFFDVLISNPPYVRTQHIQDDVLKIAKDELGLSGKIDLYQIFLVLLKNVMRPSGEIGIVVSNKFLSNKTGQSTRDIILNKYNLHSIFDFGDTRIFNVAVLPCVLFMGAEIKNTCDCDYVSVYSTQEISVNPEHDLFTALEKHEGFCKYNNSLYEIKYGKLLIENGSWRLNSITNSEFIENVRNNTKYLLQEIGKVKVGIKTTADKVFISNKWGLLAKDKPELLVDLITHRRAGNIKGKKPDGYQVLYPYDLKSKMKKVVDLNQYPLSEKYLKANHETLNGRKYIAESNKKWFEIWVSHNPYSWKKDKIVFRDICEHPTFWLDKSGAIVNGDCYWIEFYDFVNEDIIWLTLGILNSKFIEEFYDIKFNNKLYANRRRFMTQYVNQFPILDPNLPISKRIIEITKQAFFSSDDSIEGYMNEINILVNEGFNQRN